MYSWVAGMAFLKQSTDQTGKSYGIFFLIITLSLILFSCGKKVVSDDSATTELEGTWATDCYQYSNSQYNKKTVVVSGKNYTYTSADGTDYVITATLEGASNGLSEAIEATPSGLRNQQ